MGYSPQLCKESDTAEATEHIGRRVQLNHFAVCLKLTPPCKSTILQYKKNFKSHKAMMCGAWETRIPGVRTVCWLFFSGPSWALAEALRPLPPVPLQLTPLILPLPFLQPSRVVQLSNAV